MRRCLLLVVLLLLLAGQAQAASTSTRAPELEAVASQIAGQQLEVRCYINDETDVDANPLAWGYVYLYRPVVYLDPTVCEGALALARGEFKPLYKLAIGALVLAHEAYHLKVALPEWRRGDEAQTECRAIKLVPQTLLALGASQDLAEAVLPWALAAHYKISTIEEYNYPSCKVPGMEWWD